MNIRHSNILGWHGSPPARPARKRGAGARAGGFTLIELMVVLAIMAIVTALTVGTFRSLTDNNQRTGCAANLSQVYQGLRLYMADEAGQAPLYDPSKGITNAERNIGLWNLWTFPEPGKEYKIADIGAAPVGRYLRSTHVLHCPSDSEPGAEVRQNVELFVDADKKQYNPDYLSYQMFATSGPDNIYSSSDKASQIIPGDRQFQTYLPERMPTLPASPTPADKLKFMRQLRQVDQSSTKTPPDPYKRPALDNTIVTWCRHHRYARDYDNVLFMDGSVQLIPQEQDELKPDGTCDTTGNILKGSDRVPRRTGCD